MFIQKSNFVIRNTTANDVNILGNWWRDGKIMAHAGFPNGIEISNDEILKQILSDTDETCRRLIIEKNNTPIGEMNFRNKGDGIAEIGIKICDFSLHGKGLGTQLLKTLIEYLFNELRFIKIILDTNLNNLRAQHIYEKIGFRKVAVNVDSWKNQLGELQSSVDYELTKKDFAASGENCELLLD